MCQTTVQMFRDFELVCGPISLCSAVVCFVHELGDELRLPAGAVHRADSLICNEIGIPVPPNHAKPVVSTKLGAVMCFVVMQSLV